MVYLVNKTKDMSPYKIVATVKSVSKEHPCHYGHEVGDSFEFDGMELKGKLCTDAFDAIYRNVSMLMWGGNVPWMNEKEQTLLVPCPDAYSQVIFELKRVRKKK